MNFERGLDDIDERGDYIEEDDDDEEIRRLQSEIRRRRHEKKRRREMLETGGVSDGVTESVTTDQSASPGYSDIDHDNTDQVLDSDDEDFMLAETRSTDTLTECSAECIALSLLR